MWIKYLKKVFFHYQVQTYWAGGNIRVQGGFNSFCNKLVWDLRSIAITSNKGATLYLQMIKIFGLEPPRMWNKG